VGYRIWRGSPYRQRRVHLTQGLGDDDSSIVIGDAEDGVVYLHAAPLQVSVSLIPLQLFGFFIPCGFGIAIGHGEILLCEPRCALWPIPARKNNLPTFPSKQGSLLSLMLRVKRALQATRARESSTLPRHLFSEREAEDRFARPSVPVTRR
jgi:hypothetical protein